MSISIMVSTGKEKNLSLSDKDKELTRLLTSQSYAWHACKGLALGHGPTWIKRFKSCIAFTPLSSIRWSHSSKLCTEFSHCTSSMAKVQTPSQDQKSIKIESDTKLPLESGKHGKTLATWQSSMLPRRFFH